MKYDKSFTDKVQAWVNKDQHTEADALTGAQLLHQIQPRNSAYRRYLSLAVSRPGYILAKIEYELKIHLRYRLDGLTLEEVRRLDQKVVPEANSILAKGEPAADTVESNEVKSLGRRADHDHLPEEVQKLWTDNAGLYKDIKSLFEELKSMEDLPSCQRYDKLQLLAAKDKRYLANMEKYDSYVVGTSSSDDAVESEEASAPAQAEEASDFKSVSNARAYLSKNLDKFEQLAKKLSSVDADSAEANAYYALAKKMQQRADVLVGAGVMTDEMRSKLTSFGLVFPSSTSNQFRPFGYEE